jgi:hypothetical protein
LNDSSPPGARADRHGDSSGNFSVTTIQAALQVKHGRNYILHHIKKLNERTSPKWLQKQTHGRFIVLEYIKSRDAYHWIGASAEKRQAFDGAYKKVNFSISKLSQKKIAKVYCLEPKA